jgi:uncharacterized protein (DUF362 family)
MLKYEDPRLSRRNFIRTGVTTLAGLSVLPAAKSFGSGPGGTAPAAAGTTVALVKTMDRKKGVADALALLDLPSPRGKRVLVKPNFNSADPTPGSTHNDTLAQIVTEMKTRGASSLVVGERSGPPVTRKVMEEKGVLEMAETLGFDIVNFEELAESDWVPFNPPGNHWEGGFSIPRPVVDSEYTVSTCCLKTHAHGGVFTMSLKLAVGLTPKSLMRQLHRSPDQRKMIAEINQGYTPALVVMDGVEAFVDGGPSQGKKVDAGVFVAGTDRVAVDAVGLAVLQDLGSNPAVMDTKIFEQEQISRAVELGLGVGRPDLIRIVAAGAAGKAYAERLKEILLKG